MAYGYSNAELDDETSRRIMMFLLLHRYCHLNRFRSLVPVGLELSTLEQLQEYWFGL